MPFFARTYRVLGYEIPETVITTWVIMALLVLASRFAVSLMTSRPPEEPPSARRLVPELIYEAVQWLVDGAMGKENRGFIPYIGTLALFLVVANLTGLIGITPPTADLNTTLALATITFVNIQYYSIKRKGVVAYLKGFFEPVAFLAPLNVISEIALPFSMAFRLFGNMLGGAIIMGLLYSVLPAFVPVVPHMYFDIFAGIIQTFIFVMLTMTFIGRAMD
ncbi:MAG: F0F1 ATP synthase subunit A [Betaproteobacteria bacterium]